MVRPKSSALFQAYLYPLSFFRARAEMVPVVFPQDGARSTKDPRQYFLPEESAGGSSTDVASSHIGPKIAGNFGGRTTDTPAKGFNKLDLEYCSANFSINSPYLHTLIKILTKIFV